MSTAFSICVFCASSEAVSGELRAVSANFGRAVAEEGWALVYGGGGVGLMGEVARAALAAGGQVTGVIPERLAAREVALQEVSELIRTETLRERKHEMDVRSDAFVVLPGGIGTLEEFCEIITLKQLGYHRRPVVLLDPAGFWAPLRAQLDHMASEGLVHADLERLFDHATDAETAVSILGDALQGPRRVDEPTAGQRRDEAELEAVDNAS